MCLYIFVRNLLSLMYLKKTDFSVPHGDRSNGNSFFAQHIIFIYFSWGGVDYKPLEEETDPQLWISIVKNKQSGKQIINLESDQASRCTSQFTRSRQVKRTF